MPACSTANANLSDQLRARTGLGAARYRPGQHPLAPHPGHERPGASPLTLGQGGAADGVERPDRFVITAASELMAILALARISRTLRARVSAASSSPSTSAASPVTAEQLEVAGAMTVLLKDAPQAHPDADHGADPCAGPRRPLCQHRPRQLLRHRRSHGAGSCRLCGDRGGFWLRHGAGEVLQHQVSPVRPRPACVVLVATVRGLKANSGLLDVRPGQPLPASLQGKICPPLTAGCANLAWHIHNARRYGVPVVVAINRFPPTAMPSWSLLEEAARQAGARGVALPAFTDGGAGAGGSGLPRRGGVFARFPVRSGCSTPMRLSLAAKLATLAECAMVAGASKFPSRTRRASNWPDPSAEGQDHLPVCMHKTPLSIV